MKTADPTGFTGPHDVATCAACRQQRYVPGSENSICFEGRFANLSAEVRRLDAEADQISRFHKLQLDRTGSTTIEPVDVIFGRWLDQHEELAGQVEAAEKALRDLLGNDPEDNMVELVELVAKAQLDVDCEWERANQAEAALKVAEDEHREYAIRAGNEYSRALAERDALRGDAGRANCDCGHSEDEHCAGFKSRWCKNCSCTRFAPGHPLSDDYLGKARLRFETMRLSEPGRRHDLEQVVANILDHLKALTPGVIQRTEET